MINADCYHKDFQLIITLSWMFFFNILISRQDSMVFATCTQFCNIPSAWINQAENICYGTKGNDYVTFRMKQNCQLVAIRLSHVSGYVTCLKKTKKKMGL